MSGPDYRLPAAQSCAPPSHAARFLPAQPLAPAGRSAPSRASLQAEIVIPVRNEERDLAPSVRRLHAHLHDRFPFIAGITIADNGSTDGTWARAHALVSELESVRAVRLERPGRGGALRSVWSRSDAAVLAYMDVDLSTDLNALLPLLAPLTTDTGWFFDTELLVLAERAGLRIAEVPVDWIDDPDSRVKIIPTAAADLRGIARLGTGLARARSRCRC